MFSPDAFRIVFLFMSLLGVCPLVAYRVETHFKLLHVYAIFVFIVDFVGEKRVLRNKGRAALLLFIIAYFGTMLNNRHLFGFSYISYFCYYVECLLFVYSYGKSSGKWNQLTERIFAVVISGMNLINIWMFFSKYYIYIYGRGYVGMYPEENRLAGLCGNPNVLAMICLGAIVICCIRIICEQKRVWKVLFGVLCFLNFITMLLTNSRTQIYSLASMISVAVFVWMLKNTRSIKRFWEAIGVGIMCAVIIVFGGKFLQLGMSMLDVNYTYYLENIYKGTMSTTIEQDNSIAESVDEQKTSSDFNNANKEFENATEQESVLTKGETIGRENREKFNGRVGLWKTAWKLFLSHPILGTGMDDHEQAIQNLGIEKMPVSYFHNSYLEALVDFGIVGFACLLIYLFAMLKDVIRYFRFGGGNNWSLNAVLLGAVVAFFLCGLAESSLVASVYPTAIFFWMTVSRYAYFLEQENTRTGHFKPGILCRLTDSLTAKIHQKG